MRGRTNTDLYSGIAVNGTKIQCEIADGNTIMAGDFIERDYHPANDVNIDDFGITTTTNHISLCELEDGKVLVLTNAQSSTSYLNYRLYDRDFNLLSNGVLSYAKLNGSAIDCGNGKIAYFYISGSGTSRSCKLMVLNYDDSTNQITADEEVIDVGTVGLSYGMTIKPSLIKVSDGIVIAALPRDASNIGNIRIVIIDVINKQVIASKNTGVAYNSSYYTCDLYRYDTNKYIVISHLKAETYSFDGESFTLLSSISFSSSLNRIKFSYIGNLIFLGYPSINNNESYSATKYVKLKIQSDDTMTYVSEDRGTYTAGRQFLFPLQSKYFLFNHTVSDMRTSEIVSNTEIIKPQSFVGVYNESISSESSIYYGIIQRLGGSHYRLVYIKYYKSGNNWYYSIVGWNLIYNDNIEPSEDITYAKQWGGTGNPMGIAAQSGSSGDTIDVYVPLANA